MHYWNRFNVSMGTNGILRFHVPCAYLGQFLIAKQIDYKTDSFWSRSSALNLKSDLKAFSERILSAIQRCLNIKISITVVEREKSSITWNNFFKLDEPRACRRENLSTIAAKANCYLLLKLLKYFRQTEHSRGESASLAILTSKPWHWATTIWFYAYPE